jgi:succinoglycan biosynthesis protein ExoO
VPPEKKQKSVEPRVSVIIPAYNAEKYIAQAIRSALEQTERDIEVLVVDDASTDGTVDVIKSFSDGRLRLMVNERNRGPSYTRNLAIQMARGKWIALLDSDDWFAPERIQRLLRFAQVENADLVADDIYLIQDGAEHPWSTLLSQGSERFDALRHINVIDFVESNMPGRRCSRLGLTKPLMKRSFLSRNDTVYKADVRYAEDFLFYLDCLLGGARFVIVPEPYYFYRRRQGSLLTEAKLDRLTSSRTETLRLLQEEHIRRTPGLVLSLSKRLSAIEQRILYYRVAEHLKKGNVLGALIEAVRSPGFFALLTAQIRRIIYHRIRRNVCKVRSA